LHVNVENKIKQEVTHDQESCEVFLSLTINNLPEYGPFELLIYEYSLQYPQDLSYQSVIYFSPLEHLLEYQVLPWFMQDLYSYQSELSSIIETTYTHTLLKPYREHEICEGRSNYLL
jgi:hypothetical protein